MNQREIQELLQKIHDAGSMRQYCKEIAIEESGGQLAHEERERERKRKKRSDDDAVSVWACRNPDCNSLASMVETVPGRFTCLHCHYSTETLALQRGMAYSARDMVPRKSMPYSQRTHFREILALLNLVGPTIPDDLFALIRTCYQRDFAPRDPTKAVVKQILDTIEVPKPLQEKYRTRRYKRRLCDHLDRVKNYSERWIWIRWKLTGVRPKKMGSLLLEYMERYFVCMMTPWKTLRHAHDCRGRRDNDDTATCHQGSHTNRCRHNLPPYLFVIRHIFHLIEGLYEGQDLWGIFVDAGSRPTRMRLGLLTETYDFYVPRVRSKSADRINEKMREIFEYWGWQKYYRPV